MNPKNEVGAMSTELASKLASAESDNAILTETTQDHQREIRNLKQSLSDSMQESNQHHENLVGETAKHQNTLQTLSDLQTRLREAETECKRLREARDTALEMSKQTSEKLMSSMQETSALQDTNAELDAEVSRLRIANVEASPRNHSCRFMSRLFHVCSGFTEAQAS